MLSDVAYEEITCNEPLQCTIGCRITEQGMHKNICNGFRTQNW